MFKSGDNVLVLLSIHIRMLLVQWQRPFTILEIVSGDAYRVHLSGRTEIYHANMKKY